MSRLRSTLSARAARLRQLWRAVRGDGCTAVPDLGFTDCCNNHDRDYRTHVDHTGRPLPRWRADARLLRCMLKSKAHPRLIRWTIGPIFFIGVRLFGRKFWKSKPQD